MTKRDLIEMINDLPDNSQIDVYDTTRYVHPTFNVNISSYTDYDEGLPIITFELA